MGVLFYVVFFLISAEKLILCTSSCILYINDLGPVVQKTMSLVNDSLKFTSSDTQIC